ncbi:DNA-3-methyladenine glycosylase family protein [Alkalihalobacterium alkalinitrilicum]|uniref:DNA-3-methyladenine glycosylase family protein n=1 Tax=Alkalihalobacterium alkalinitrilicum TaxID=427920 RepID=UPI000995D0BB|nr:DNA-3-methyladenine glycosylase [Alkalihalobacterium alkalinitrilicum]
MNEMILEIKTPYSVSHMLKRLSNDPLHVVDLINQEVKVPIYAENEVVTLSFSQTDDTTKVIISGNISDKEKTLEKLETIFLWNVDLQPIKEHFQHTKLAALFEIFHGAPIVCDFDLYGCLMKTIIHQQLNMKFAHELTSRFVNEFGYEIEGVLFYPRPEQVCELRVEQLRKLQFSQRKAEYIIDTSKRIMSGEVNLEAFRDQRDEEVMETLVQIRGIGKWTAESFLLFGLGRPNLLPAADVGIQNALKRLYQLDTKPKAEEVIEMAKDWKPYSSYASLYLWLSVEQPHLLEHLTKK